MTAVAKTAARMSLAEFLAWNPGDGGRWELVDGEARAMAPAGNTHGALQAELARLIGNLLADRAGPCRVVTAPGIVPRARAKRNFRVPDLAVICSTDRGREYPLTDPMLIVEILSPRNRSETWANVWTYTTIPSVGEILILHTEPIRADLLRRLPDGSWPKDPETMASGELTLDSIDFRTPLAALCRTTRLATAPG